MQVKLFGKTIFETKSSEQPAPEPQAYYGGLYENVYVLPFNGEKNLGEIGPIRRYIVDHDALRLRSWQLYLESEICQAVFKRFAKWNIGSGLKLQAEPQETVLVSEGIKISKQDFCNATESRFKVYAESDMCDYSSTRDLAAIANEAFINAIVGGDVLVVLRLIDGQVKVQLIDGAHVNTPMNLRFSGSEYVTESGNKVKHGIEVDNKGKPLAYYVQRGGSAYSITHERISARSSNGSLMAFMVFGLTYRLDNVRGIPLITAVMETAKKLERYKEATLGSAEERQKIAYTIEHDATSTGENPLVKNLAKASGFNNGNGEIPIDVKGKKLADLVAATVNKQAFNMPIGSKMTALESRNELYFKDFYSVNIDLVCATIGIPPEVALSKYDSNYSASRAAIKDWEHSLNVDRKKFARQFYQNIYSLWLDVQVLSGKVHAPGYLTSIFEKNAMATNAYRFARWVGATVPHIDPLKEVQAERAKLGSGSAHLPLTTVEAATEALNGGDSLSNMQQYSEELGDAKNLGIEEPISPDRNQRETND